MENEVGVNNEQSMSNIRVQRNWSAIEEETLLTILEEMVVAGNKGENGTFKTGTHEEVCKRMKNKIPGIAINVKQIVNKMKRWAMKLNDVVDMMNTSGFGWDDTKMCVVCDSSQVLSQYLEKHPKVGNHVNKEFERLQGIFGKDRANDPSKPDPSKADLVDEIKKLGLTGDEEIDLVIKFSHNQQYEKFFWEFEGSQIMTFVRKIMRMT
ncbi:hypothetical protein TSUD_416050 [Trifolium subterraneum]|uniref:Myb/SANT-like domain-containing protein n=1 Tax=Trifolium subterraneum TaxID=3900 RepID=A0A2Z6PJM6_TRISU|nr:hypothetical protein TSUD_416050 [Trifolium subterraneum]